MVDVEIIKEDDAVEKARLHVSYYINLPRNITVTKTNYVLNKNAAESRSIQFSIFIYVITIHIHHQHACTQYYSCFHDKWHTD